MEWQERRLVRIEQKIDDLNDRITALWTNGLAKLDRRVARLEAEVEGLGNRWPAWSLVLLGLLLALGGEAVRRLLGLLP